MNKLVNEHYLKGKETTDWKIHLITDNFPKTSINSENPNLEEKQSNKDSPKPSPMKMYRRNEQMQGSSLALLPDICKFRYPDVIIQPIGANSWTPKIRIENEVKQQEYSLTTDGSARWYRHFERQFVSFLQN